MQVASCLACMLYDSCMLLCIVPLPNVFNIHNAHATARSHFQLFIFSILMILPWDLVSSAFLPFCQLSTVRFLYSNPLIYAFSRPLHNDMQPRPITLLCHASMRGSHPLPDQLPGEHTGHMPQAVCWSYLYNRLDCCHSHTHSQMVTADRSTVVEYVPMVHMCSFMCTNHIDMIAHIPAF